jgi:hypothetical protein
MLIELEDLDEELVDDGLLDDELDRLDDDDEELVDDGLLRLLKELCELVELEVL